MSDERGVTPLARAVEAGRAAYGEAVSRAIWGVIPTGGDVIRDTVLAALDVLGPVIVERAREEGPRIAENFPASPTYPDWPAIRASLTEREP